MADTFNMLESVKTSLGITGNYHDSLLNNYIDEVNEYLIDAGVNEMLINTKVSAGVVARGVSDLWNYGSGEGKLSTYFYQRVIQLASRIIDRLIERLIVSDEEGNTYRVTVENQKAYLHAYGKVGEAEDIYIKDDSNGNTYKLAVDREKIKLIEETGNSATIYLQDEILDKKYKVGINNEKLYYEEK